MKKFFTSFYGKLTLVFLVIIILLGISQVLITTNSFIQFNRDVDQRLNLNLAKDMAIELTELLGGELNLSAIGERIHYMMVMNPKIEIYLLDDHGNILAFFAEPGKSIKSDLVDLNSIHRFLLQPENAPVLGSDPRQPGKQKPFSVAEIDIGEGKQGYLYIVIGGEEYDSINSLYRNSYIIRTMITGLLLSLLVAGVIGTILFALLTRRLTTISDVVKNFEQGKLEDRIVDSHNDEFGQLGKSFNRMADTIQDTIDKLKENDALRRELIANVSHDLRTPLASIQGYIETILMKEHLPDAKKMEYLEIILKNTLNLSKQINELFELSKLEAKQVVPDIEPFSITELAQDVVMQFASLAEKKDITLVHEFEPNLSMVVADLSLIDRVLGNLIKNALEHTPEKGKITLCLTQGESSISVSVIDTGKGIQPEDVPHIFDRYYSGNKKTLDGLSSTGLGLTIAHKILEAHQKELKVDSTPDVGTTFSFTLPSSL